MAGLGLAPGLIPAVVATAILSLTMGYWIGVGSSLKLSSRSEDDDSELEEEEEEENQQQHRECKLMLCIRTDLGMGKGKVAAQCGHATLACYKSASKRHPNVLKAWEASGQTKIAVKVPNEEDLWTLLASAQSLKLDAKIIQDAGRTQIAAGSATVLGILGPIDKVDVVTRHLTLY